MKRQKYNASPVVIDGIRFASKREGARYQELKLLEKAGAISNLELQPKFPIYIPGEGPVKIRSSGFPNGRQVTHLADFAYFRDNQRIVEDIKGWDTPVSRLKRALVEAIYHVKIEVVK